MRTPPLVLVVVLGFVSASCGSAEEDPPDPLGERIESADVVDDPFPTDSCCRDRRAHPASIGGPDAVLSSPLGHRRCGEEEPPSCDLEPSQGQAARDFAGDDAVIRTRGMLVNDGDGTLGVMTLHVAENGEGDRVLIDRLGRACEGGLRDFQESRAEDPSLSDCPCAPSRSGPASARSATVLGPPEGVAAPSARLGSARSATVAR